MGKELLYTIAGALIGSLIEEGIEEVFPGVGELGFAGEIGGAIAGFLAGENAEIKHAAESFVRFAYRNINKRDSVNSISDKDLKAFSLHFEKIPSNKKKEILNNFKTMAPFEYDYIRDMLVDMEASL